jgi:hypothetical protein
MEISKRNWTGLAVAGAGAEGVHMWALPSEYFQGVAKKEGATWWETLDWGAPLGGVARLLKLEMKALGREGNGPWWMPDIEPDVARGWSSWAGEDLEIAYVVAKTETRKGGFAMLGAWLDGWAARTPEMAGTLRVVLPGNDRFQEAFEQSAMRWLSREEAVELDEVAKNVACASLSARI